jgi:hypothetical protein
MQQQADVVEEWLQGGATAVMMVTSALQYPDVSDPAYITETGQLLAGTTPMEAATAITWLARMAAQAILDKHDGARELAEQELRGMAMMMESVKASELDGI